MSRDQLFLLVALVLTPIAAFVFVESRDTKEESREVCREAKRLPDGYTRLRMCVPRYMYESTYRDAWAAEDAKARSGS